MTNPTQSTTDAELVREARGAAESFEILARRADTQQTSLALAQGAELIRQLASRIEALSASRRGRDRKIWRAGFSAHGDWQPPYETAWASARCTADLDALEREGK